MQKKPSNFSRAVEELMQGHVFSATTVEEKPEVTREPVREAVKAEPVKEEPVVQDTVQKVSISEVSTMSPASQVATPTRAGNDIVSDYVIGPPRQIFSKEEARITKDMTIKGSIITGSDVKIAGCVYGDVEAKGDVFISGTIEGQVIGQSVTLDSATIKGDIHSSTTVMVGKNTQQTGDIEADHVEVDGMISGNVSARGTILLRANAIVEGNIRAAALSMSEGAELKGSLDISKTR
jgi:cytoskeletal protein CcmA (bactofilin family)